MPSLIIVGYALQISGRGAFFDYQGVLDDSGCNPNKVWVDEGTKFYNGSMK